MRKIMDGASAGNGLNKELHINNFYYVNDDGEVHRTDGPAIIRFDGSVEYWVHGKKSGNL